MEARLALLERMEITSMRKWIRHEYDYTTALHDFISQMSYRVIEKQKRVCTVRDSWRIDYDDLALC